MTAAGAAVLARLAGLAGVWTGEGQTADGSRFTGRLELVPVVAGRGVALLYRAEGAEGAAGTAGELALLHEEDTLCAPLADGTLALFVLCLELPGVQVLRLEAPTQAGQDALVFADPATRIRLDRDGPALGYTWARRGPGGWRDVTAVRVERTGTAPGR